MAANLPSLLAATCAGAPLLTCLETVSGKIPRGGKTQRWHAEHTANTHGPMQRVLTWEFIVAPLNLGVPAVPCQPLVSAGSTHKEKLERALWGATAEGMSQEGSGLVRVAVRTGSAPYKKRDLGWTRPEFLGNEKGALRGTTVWCEPGKPEWAAQNDSWEPLNTLGATLWPHHLCQGHT